MMHALRIHPTDDVAVAVEAVKKGEAVLGVTAREDIPAGHKLALRPIQAGETFKFDKLGRHSVKADGPFKMALFLTLDA